MGENTKKVLFLSNTANFSKFNLPYMRWFREQGWQVDYASAGEEEVKDCDNQYTISIARSPFSLKNFKAYRQLKKILLENHYDILHCHTPMGGVLGRLAAKKLWKEHKIKVIYTAHGFHFYKGAPVLNWLLYYPMEKWLSHCTDVIVTINEESPVYNIVFWVSDISKDYVATKPIHDSQKNISGSEEEKLREMYTTLSGGSFFSIDCKENYELIRELTSFGKELIVLSPVIMREKIEKRISEMMEQYKSLEMRT